MRLVLCLLAGFTLWITLSEAWKQYKLLNLGDSVQISFVEEPKEYEGKAAGHGMCFYLKVIKVEYWPNGTPGFGRVFSFLRLSPQQEETQEVMGSSRGSQI